MSKAVHIFFGVALTLCACAQPKCLDTHFHPLRKHSSVPVSRSVGKIEKAGEKRAGFFLLLGFSIVPTDREPGTDYKSIHLTPMVTSVEELDTTSKITCEGKAFIGSTLLLFILSCV